MIDERIILQVLAEQRDEIACYDPAGWVPRREESLFEFESTMAQVVIGVRRSGKSTICHKVLLEHNIQYGYVNLDDDRLLGMEAKDLNREDFRSCRGFGINEVTLKALSLPYSRRTSNVAIKSVI